MSEPADPLALVRRAVDELLPRLTERLASHGLGEIEVRDGDLRVRVARALPEAAATHSPPPGPAAVRLPADRVGVVPSGPVNHGITSPAVGFFVYAEGLGPGLPVDKGDDLGHVEMLGVRHEVRAPRRGTVRHLVTEAGDPVEYGQLLIELEPAE
jgi:acetyl-CoA carboxylase biotin carboxyl carrier protein